MNNAEKNTHARTHTFLNPVCKTSQLATPTVTHVYTHCLTL